MKISEVEKVKASLVETGGRTSQELGVGRIVGQVLVHLYLTDGESSLDEIGKALELSKASTSIAARQLEKIGLVKRSWKKGDRKNYYRTADNFETALRSGLISFIRQKILAVGVDLDNANDLLSTIADNPGQTSEATFIHNRVKRAKELRDCVKDILENPLFNIFVV